MKIIFTNWRMLLLRSFRYSLLNFITDGFSCFHNEEINFFRSIVSPIERLTLRVSHTAIYLRRWQFIHYANLVRINTMKSGAANYAYYQSRTLVCARKMLHSIGKYENTGIDQHPYHKIVLNNSTRVNNQLEAYEYFRRRTSF